MCLKLMIYKLKLLSYNLKYPPISFYQLFSLQILTGVLNKMCVNHTINFKFVNNICNPWFIRINNV